MEMTNAEIVRQYKEAKQKNKKIKILAQLNACDETTIRKILIEGGAIEEKTQKPTVRSEIPDRKLRVTSKAGTVPYVIPQSIVKAITIQLDRIEENIKNYEQLKKNTEEQLLAANKEYKELSDFIRGIRTDE